MSQTGKPDVTVTKDNIASLFTSSFGSSSSSGSSSSGSSSSGSTTSGSGAIDASIPPQVLKIAGQEFQQLIGTGVVMTQDGNSWYVSPVRSYAEIFVSLLKGLEPSDVDYLISLAGK